MKPNFLGNRQAASPVLSQFVSRLAALALVGQCTVIALSHDAAEMPSVPDVSGNVFTRGETELHRALEDGRIASSGYQTDANILYLTGGDRTDYAQERCRLDVYYPTDQRGFATVVWFHGGGLTGGNRSVPGPLKEQGIAVVSAGSRPDRGQPGRGWVSQHRRSGHQSVFQGHRAFGPRSRWCTWMKSNATSAGRLLKSNPT